MISKFSKVDMISEFNKSIEIGILTNEFKDMIFNISDNTSHMLFSQAILSQRDVRKKCVDFSVEYATNNWTNFNPDKGDIYKYFSEILKQGLVTKHNHINNRYKVVLSRKNKINSIKSRVCQ